MFRESDQAACGHRFQARGLVVRGKTSDHGDGLTAIRQHHFLSGANGADHVREFLVRLAEAKSHVVMLLQLDVSHLTPRRHAIGASRRLHSDPMHLRRSVPAAILASVFVLASELIGAQTPVQQLPPPPDVAAAPRDASVTASGLASKVITPGHGGAKPVAASTVKVHYSGWTTDGQMFDSSVTRGATSSFPLRGVIRGWTEVCS